jgi:hypothetical protein
MIEVIGNAHFTKVDEIHNKMHDKFTDLQSSIVTVYVVALRTIPKKSFTESYNHAKPQSLNSKGNSQKED